MCILLVALACLVHANNVLPPAWVPLAYGECTKEPVDLTAEPPYVAPNDDWMIAEGVGSTTVGKTCNLNKNSISTAAMSELYNQNFLLAASQDLYNGKHTQDNFNDDCNHHEVTEAEAIAGTTMCGSACGVCFLVSGPSGSAVFIVNEIADIGAVGQNGEGLNLHLDDDHALEVRPGLGIRKDIRYKRVPCPVGDSGISVLVAGNYGPSAVYLTILNHRVALKAVFARGGPGGETEWVALTRDWTNRWHWESYGCPTCVPWQSGPISRGSTASDFQLRLVGEGGVEAICVGLSQSTSEGEVMACQDESGGSVQFPPSSTPFHEACDGSTPSNLDLYTSADGTTTTGATSSGTTTTGATTSGTTTTGTTESGTSTTDATGSGSASGTTTTGATASGTSTTGATGSGTTTTGATASGTTTTSATGSGTTSSTGTTGISSAMRSVVPISCLVILCAAVLL